MTSYPDGNVASSNILCWIRDELGYIEGERKRSIIGFTISDFPVWASQKIDGVIVKSEWHRIRATEHPKRFIFHTLPCFASS